MAFATSNVAGVNFYDIFTPPSAGDYNYGAVPAASLGTRVLGSDGSVWVYVVLGSGGTTAQGYVCRYDEAFTAVMLSTGNDDFGDLVGVPVCAAAAAGDYIWLQIAGTCDYIQVAASTAANIALTTTGTAGQMDDAGGLIVSNMVLTTARGGTVGTAPGILNFPVITATSGP